MTIANGDRLPEVELRTVRRGEVVPTTTGDYFGGRRVALFGVPGAFTPACSDVHLPGYLVRSDAMREAGIDAIACVAVNDAFVMDAWGRARGAEGTVDMLADGNGELARAMGLEIDLSIAGFGRRMRRFAAIVDDRVVEHLEVEPGRGVTVSAADALLARLQEGAR